MAEGTTMGEVWPPLVTPFTASGDIDYPALAQLVEVYVDSGVTGLLVLGLSAEPLELTAQERWELASFVARCIDGRIRFTIAAFADESVTFAEQARHYLDLGSEATVLLASQLVPQPASDSEFGAALGELFDVVPGALGIYEAPLPYKRVVGESSFRMIAESGRVSFMKDTSQDEAAMLFRGANAGSVALLNAEIYSLRESRKLGYAGFCGLIANVYPSYVARVADLMDDEGVRFSQLLTIADAALEKGYPTSAKYLIAKSASLDFSSFSRRLGRAAQVRELTSLLAFDQYLRDESR